MSTADSTNRRHFISSLAGMAGLAAAATVAPWERAGAIQNDSPVKTAWDDSWTQRLGQHRVVFDHSEIDQAPGAWVIPDVMDAYNEVLGTKDADLGMVLILRHLAVPLFFNDALWTKYELGAFIKEKFPDTKKVHALNPMREHVQTLQKRGVTVLGCNRAVQGMSGMLATKAKVDKETMRKEVMENMFPGIILLPNGLYALARAQEVGCALMRQG
jgi:hypothetical protein